MDPRRTATEVALDCGFSHAQHFSTAFKKATGVTPSDFRRAAMRCSFELSSFSRPAMLKAARMQDRTTGSGWNHRQKLKAQHENIIRTCQGQSVQRQPRWRARTDRVP